MILLNLLQTGADPDKICSKCQTRKQGIDFPSAPNTKDRKYPWCRPCLSAHRKERYQKKPRAFWIAHKKCSRCERDLPRDQYRKYDGGNLHYRCTECEDEIALNEAQGRNQCGSCCVWKPLHAFYPCKRHKHRSQCLECGKRYNEENRDKTRCRALRKRFGITLLQYKELLDAQGGKCPVCDVAFDPGNYSYPVDHAHSGPHRGKIRGIVHDTCNRFVLAGHADGRLLRAAAALIERPLTLWVVPDAFVHLAQAANDAESA